MVLLHSPPVQQTSIESQSESNHSSSSSPRKLKRQPSNYSKSSSHLQSLKLQLQSTSSTTSQNMPQLAIFNDFIEVSPKGSAPMNSTYTTVRPPLKPSVAISSVDTISTSSSTNSHSLNSTPVDLPRSTSLPAAPINRRRATYTHPNRSPYGNSSSSSHLRSLSIVSSSSSSSASHVGNPFYKPKKDLSAATISTSTSPQETLFNPDLLSDFSLKRRKLSDSIFDDLPLDDYTDPSYFLNDFISVLDD
ncbi:hypothetical protein CAAN1_14S00452 [[Candida] anglica]|uniref:Uncharacterized protein n=1 Tax=[Candida] anglica TaxID=148631 RepID=A0ABP0ENE9_9ASCO